MFLVEVVVQIWCVYKLFNLHYEDCHTWCTFLSTQSWMLVFVLWCVFHELTLKAKLVYFQEYFLCECFVQTNTKIVKVINVD